MISLTIIGGLFMAGIRFTEEQLYILSQNKNIKKVTTKSITYSDEFKVHAVKEVLVGKAPSNIFKESDFNLDVLGRDIPSQCIKRWKKLYLEHGELGLRGERRGIHNNKAIKCDSDSLEDRLAQAEAKIAYLEMENDFLKKLDELERRKTLK